MEGSEVTVEFCGYDSSSALKYWSIPASFSGPREQTQGNREIKTYDHTIHSMHGEPESLFEV